MDKRFTSTLSVAMLAGAGWCASALAQDKPATPANADKTQVVPGKKDLKPYPATVEKMDDNTQRIHDRDSAAVPQGSTSNAKTTAGQQVRKVPEGVRDWAAIDKNGDHLISPEEMEAALNDGRPPAAPAAAKK
jgi:hypothetical protein